MVWKRDYLVPVASHLFTHTEWSSLAMLKGRLFAPTFCSSTSWKKGWGQTSSELTCGTVPDKSWHRAQNSFLRVLEHTQREPRCYHTVFWHLLQPTTVSTNSRIILFDIVMTWFPCLHRNFLHVNVSVREEYWLLAIYGKSLMKFGQSEDHILPPRQEVKVLKLLVICWFVALITAAE